MDNRYLTLADIPDNLSDKEIVERYTIVKVVQRGSFRDVFDRARRTVNLEPSNRVVTSRAKRRLMLSEHSPIRDLTLCITLWNVPNFAVTHLLRHTVGVTPYIATNRDDRVKVKRRRRDKSQCELVSADFVLNIQSLINMARRRCCFKSDEATVALFNEILLHVYECDESYKGLFVKECVYRGFCPEMEQCERKYSDSIAFRDERANYMSIRKE